MGLFPISEFPRISVIVLRLSKTLYNGFDHKITTQKSGLFFRTDHEPFDENCMCLSRTSSDNGALTWKEISLSEICALSCSNSKEREQDKHCILKYKSVRSSQQQQANPYHRLDNFQRYRNPSV